MKTIDIRPYHGRLYITTSCEEYIAQSNEWTGDDCEEAVQSCNGMCHQHGSEYLIGVFGGGISVLAHELVHLCFWEANRTRFLSSMDGNDEPFAYLLEDLMDRVLEELPELCVIV